MYSGTFFKQQKTARLFLLWLVVTMCVKITCVTWTNFQGSKTPSTWPSQVKLCDIRHDSYVNEFTDSWMLRPRPYPFVSVSVGAFKLNSNWPPATARSVCDCRGGDTNTAIKLDTWWEQKGLIRVDSTDNTWVEPVLSACKTQQLTTSLSSPQIKWQNWAIYWRHHHHIIVTLYTVHIIFFNILTLPTYNALYFLLVLLTLFMLCE